MVVTLFTLFADVIVTFNTLISCSSNVISSFAFDTLYIWVNRIGFFAYTFSFAVTLFQLSLHLLSYLLTNIGQCILQFVHHLFSFLFNYLTYIYILALNYLFFLVIFDVVKKLIISFLQIQFVNVVLHFINREIFLRTQCDVIPILIYIIKMVVSFRFELKRQIQFGKQHLVGQVFYIYHPSSPIIHYFHPPLHVGLTIHFQKSIKLQDNNQNVI